MESIFRHKYNVPHEITIYWVTAILGIIYGQLLNILPHFVQKKQILNPSRKTHFDLFFGGIQMVIVRSWHGYYEVVTNGMGLKKK